MCAKLSKGARSLQELASKALGTWSCHNALSNQLHTFQLGKLVWNSSEVFQTNIVVVLRACHY